MAPRQKDSSVPQVALMDRPALTHAILAMDCDFPVDLTEEYLRDLSVKKLRHLYTALCAHAKKSSDRGPS